jgi:glycosyltransferase involved in cell wall biosynthesis
VSHGSTGLLVPPNDPHALAAAVGRILGDPGLALRIAAAGRRSAQTRFGSARYRADIAALVGELAGVAPDQARSVPTPR